MQVFKLYFKILNKNKGQIFMYVGIFMGILFGFILPNADKNSPKDFSESTTKYAIFDYDNSELSKGIAEYLEENHKKKSIKNDDKETIQDAMYNMDVSCVVRILDGFEEGFLKGEGDKYIEVYRIPGLSMAILFEEDMRSYLNVVDTYIKSGHNVKDSLIGVVEAQEIEVEVSLPEGTKVNNYSVAHWFFSYIPWIFIGMCVCAIAPVLVVFNKKVVKERIECSPYKFTKMNLEVILGVVVTGMVICIAFAVASLVGFGSDMKVTQGALYIGNMFCMMTVALAITFIISKLTSKGTVISLLANVVSLGMAFLTGVFVPMEMLSDTVIKIAHFLPSYWYELAVIEIDNYSGEVSAKIMGYMGVQLLFAVAIVILAMVISKKKRVA
ncbi:MAG: ABC transporter permease [Lachnospiraceae bacterium]|nr:ABC transporter permease [Lachnospiraceae bacterium]